MTRRGVETVVGLFALACALVPSASAAPAGAVRAHRAAISVSPAEGLLDAPTRIVVSGVRSRSEVVVRASTRDYKGARWQSAATFTADASGRADLTRTAARRGSYLGRDGMGLFWSMQPAERPAPGGATLLFLERGFNVRFDVLVAGRTVASTTAVRRDRTASVTTRYQTLAGEGFIGEYASGASTVRAPALLLIGGSEGGLTGFHTGPLLASHGFSTLSLAYFGEGALPKDLREIPLEYFVRALEWLRAQPQVDPERIVVYGVSRGSEAALLLGASSRET